MFLIFKSSYRIMNFRKEQDFSVYKFKALFWVLVN